MRKHWILSWTLLATVAGCAVPGFPGKMQTAQQPLQTQLAVRPPAPQTSGFTQRVVDAVIPGSPKAAVQQYSNVNQPAKQKTDPTSLGFADSGPPNATLFLSMAQLSDQGGNVDHARSMYQRALSLEPKNIKALMGLARLEDREGRMEDAIRVYQQALATQPQNAQVLNDLALCHARIEQLSLSLQLLRQATRLQPEKALYRNNIAKVLIELNRVDEAASHQAAVHPPAVAQYNTGVLLHQRGRDEEAVSYLIAATHIDPQLQAASTLLSQINNHTTRIVNAGVPAPNDDILPTPLTPPATAPGGAYPTTGALSAVPTVQSVPAETAQVPVGHAPTLLPPVR